MRTYETLFLKYDSISKIFVISLFCLIFLLNFKSFPGLLKINYIPFWLVILIFLYGTFIGIIYNKPIDAFNDLSSYFPILLILIIPKFLFYDIGLHIIKMVNILIYILLFKFFLNQIASIIIWGSPSWKILFKQSPVLLIPYSIYLGLYFKKFKIKYFIFLFLILLLLILAMSRMIFICIIYITLYHFFNNFRLKKLINLIILCFIFLISFFTYFQTQKSENQMIFDNIYGGTTYENGLEYRQIQLNLLTDRFLSHPFEGVGFGAYTKGYETYEDLSKPYQLELDLINFFSKIGFIFSFIYLISYYKLHILVKKVEDINLKSIFISFEIGIIAILIYSLGQTSHQSYLYWVVYSIFYSLLLIVLKKQNIINKEKYYLI